MNLREALKVLGVERVRRGMRAIDNPRPKESGSELRCQTCFVGEAFGGTYDGYKAACGYSLAEPTSRIQEAARVVEAAYEGWAFVFKGEYYERLMVSGIDGWRERFPISRAELRAECVLYLAENGVAVEPAVRVHEPV